MDDYDFSALHESKNEWGSRLVTLLTPLIIDGYKSILDESIKLCRENGENDKYLMTFQNLISRIPKWNSQIIETERKRICEKSGCSYLEELVTCVHIIQLKILTAMRVGQKQKKIDINIPKLDDFVHKTYINVARKVYKNVYLFEVNLQPLQIQKNHRELEIIIQECILNTIRDSIPIEAILKAYMEETVEEDVREEVNEQIIEEPIREPIVASQQVEKQYNQQEEQQTTSLTFNEIDYVKNDEGIETNVVAPKSISHLEAVSEIRAQKRKMENEENEENENDNFKINISDQSFHLDSLDIHNIEEPQKQMELFPDLLTDELDIEVLD
jgi:hypothetical protein